ncbi:substrate-binding domain-containing protein [Chromobacterium sp. IIBBL 290-4]|uniref:substrate-binding domain-containing protein n=1 Tax=Chromobacterium sp. IIBBL 290-4 TaxID=2953890 RepID=UPI0020B8E2FC|nr:substrate-binding domain-containing protein [Chromobacterium sp. IIBBL 290-4]UTH73241.1 substrate-binding domain-containing protein [Chromobacterium sp. IIBBL 290-4]
MSAQAAGCARGFGWMAKLVGASLAVSIGLASAPAMAAEIVYITAKADLPFWDTVGKGVKSVAAARGYSFSEMDSKLSADIQLNNVRQAVDRHAAGIVISPINSKAAEDALTLAKRAGIPVSIADIGTTGGDYVSFVKSDNYRGAYDVGVELAAAFKGRGWDGASYGMITIELSRKNGQDRSNGFRDAMKDAGFPVEIVLRQMKDYSAEETYRYVKEILAAHPKIRGFFIETDQPVEGAMRAIREAGKEKQVLLVSFDAMPDVVKLLKSDALIAVGMQQPYLMGGSAADALVSHLQGRKPAKEILVPILVATGRTVDQLMSVAAKTVFGKPGK